MIGLQIMILIVQALEQMNSGDIDYTHLMAQASYQADLYRL
jgi:hypothetical protein